MSEEGAAPLRSAVGAQPAVVGLEHLELLREYMIVVCVVVLFLVLTFTSDTFLTSTNLLNVLQQVAPVGMVAFALTFLLIVGEFDLSSGALFVLTGVLAAKLQPHFGTWPALLLATWPPPPAASSTGCSSPTRASTRSSARWPRASWSPG